MSIPSPWPTLADRLTLEHHGHKAFWLSRAVHAGLRVPPGVTIPAGAARSLPRYPPTDASMLAPLRADVQAALRLLGRGPWILRSSARDEDIAGASAAGLYRSEPDLDTLDAVLNAMTRCYQAGDSPGLVRYRALRSLPPSPGPLALILQRQITPRWAGVLFSRVALPDWRLAELSAHAPNAVTEGTHPTQRTLWPAGSPPSPFPPPAGSPSVGAGLEALADHAARLLGGPADLEWAVDSEETLWLLQLRPEADAGGADGAAPPEEACLPLADACWQDGTWWTPDVEHNPDPLSPLHADLVAYLDARLELPFALRTVGRRLHTALRPGRAVEIREAPATAHRCAAQPRRWWQAEALPRLERSLESLESDPPGGTGIASQLAAFSRFYALYAGETGPVLTHALTLLGPDEPQTGAAHTRLPLSDAIRSLAAVASQGDRLERWLARGVLPPADARGGPAYRQTFASWIRRVGGLFPRWDLAAPPLQETPGDLHRAVARHLRSLAPPPPGDAPSPPGDAPPSPRDARGTPSDRSPAPPPELETPRSAILSIREEDDLLFGRALTWLRACVLHAGRSALRAAGLDDHPDLLFQLDWRSLQRAEQDPLSMRSELRALAAHTLPATHAKDTRPRTPSSLPWSDTLGALQAPRPLRGTGCGRGKVVGRARVASAQDDLVRLVNEPPPNDVLVCPTLLPGSVPFLVGARGVVTDHGGPLSHAAILVRELSVPAVLGTRDATIRIRSGDRLELDLDRGVVTLLGSSDRDPE